jgi:hypothetical protein
LQHLPRSSPGSARLGPVRQPKLAVSNRWKSGPGNGSW